MSASYSVDVDRKTEKVIAFYKHRDYIKGRTVTLPPLCNCIARFTLIDWAEDKELLNKNNLYFNKKTRTFYEK